MLIQCGVLVRALKSLVTIIDRKATPPFDCVRFEPVTGGVAITATDGSLSASLTMPAEHALDVCVPVRDLLVVVNGVGRGHEVSVALEDSETVRVSYPGGTATLPHARASGFGASVMPTLPRRRRPEVDAGAFGAALRWASLAMGSDETRPYVCGVLLDGDKVVATDGHRLHVANVPGLRSEGMLVPAKAVELLRRLVPRTGKLAVAASDRVMWVGNEDWSVRTKLLAHEQFPPYEQVIPAPTSAAFTMGAVAEDLQRAVHRVGVGTGKRSVPLRMTANGKIILTMASENVQRAATVEPTRSTHDDLAGDHVIGIDGRYLRDAVDVSGEVQLRFGDVLEPIVVDGKARLAVVMPIRL